MRLVVSVSLLILCFSGCGRSGVALKQNQAIAPVLHGVWVLFEADQLETELGSIAVGSEQMTIHLPGMPGAIAHCADMDLDSVYGSGLIELEQGSLFIRRVEADVYQAGSALVSPSLHIDIYQPEGHRHLRLWPKQLHTVAQIRAQAQKMEVQLAHKHVLESAALRMQQHATTPDQIASKPSAESEELEIVDQAVVSEIQDATESQIAVLSDVDFQLQVESTAPSFAPLVKRFISLTPTQQQQQYRRLGDAVRYGLMQKQLLARHKGPALLADAGKLLHEWMAFKQSYRAWGGHL